jgi:hypothetical protein
LTVAGISLAGEKDPVVLLTAFQRGAVLISENHQDFLLLHWAWRLWSEAWPASASGVSAGPVHAGILTVAQRPGREVEQTAEAVQRLLRSGWPLTNELYRWRGYGDWEHYPALRVPQ